MCRNRIAAIVDQGRRPTIADLIECRKKIPADRTVKEVQGQLASMGPIGAVAVVEAERPAGLVMSIHLDRILSQRYGVSLFEKRPIGEVMDTAPLMLAAETPIAEAAHQAMNREPVKIYDHIIIVDAGRFLGLVSVQNILLNLAELQKKRSAQLTDTNRRLVSEIQEREAAEHRLRKFERIVSVSKDLMALADTDYVYQTVNDAYATAMGCSREAIVGRSTADMFGEDFFLKELKPRIDQCLGGEIVRFHTTAPFQGTGTRDLDVAYYPYVDTDGRVTGYVINSRDITEFKQLETALKQSHKMEAIGTMAGGIAHDFNNILSAILGYAELLRLSSSPDAFHSQAVSQIVTASLRAKELVGQILAFSRKIDSNKTILNLSDVVKDALKLVRASLPSSVFIEFNDLCRNSAVVADRTQIDQVIMNLCTNAAHAMERDGGTLGVTVAESRIPSGGLPGLGDLEPGRYVKLSVRDTGEGIPGEILNRIFDPYFSTKPQGKGTGMGLSVVHGIVTNHQGKIAVASEPKKGSVFDIYLPATDAQPAVYATDAGETPVGTERVMLIDDEPAVINVSRTMLEYLGYRVQPFTDPVRAFDDFRQQPDAYDLVVTDMTMPGITGDKLAERMMRIKPDVRIILSSGYSKETDLTQQCIQELGIKGFIMKPFTIKSLANQVREVLDG